MSDYVGTGQVYRRTVPISRWLARVVWVFASSMPVCHVLCLSVLRCVRLSCVASVRHALCLQRLF